MWLWIAIWGILLVLSFREKTSKPVLWGCVLVLSVLAGIRNVVIGTDTQTYNEIFDYIKMGGLFPDVGWWLVNWVVGALGLGYNWLLWLASILTLFFATKAFTAVSPNPQLSLFVYYSMYAYLNSLNGMRQFMAISIVLWGFSFLYRDKNWRFVLAVLLAATVHISAIIALLALIVKTIRLTPAVLYVSVGLSLIAGLLFMTEDILAPLIGDYSYYLDRVRESMTSAVLMALLMAGLMAFVYHTSPEEFRNNLWMKLFWMAILFTNLTIKLDEGTRIILYFTITQTILYPLYLSVKTINVLMVRCVVTAYLLVVFIKILLLGGGSYFGVYPYQVFWQ